MAITASTPIELVETGLRGACPSGSTPAGSASTRRSPSPRRSWSTTSAIAETGGLERGRRYTDFDPDRIAMQDATAQMACCSS